MESRTMRIRTTALHVVITVSNTWNLMMLIHLLLKETGLFLLHKNYITVFFMYWIWSKPETKKGTRCKFDLNRLPLLSM